MDDNRRAPRPQKKKRPNFLVRLLAFLVTAALVLGAVALVVNWDKINLDALRRHSRREIGREVSVTGYDTPILTGLEAYSITGLTQDMDGLCSDAVELLETLMEDPERPPQLLTRPMHLTIRSSSRPLPREMEQKKG